MILFNPRLKKKITNSSISLSLVMGGLKLLKAFLQIAIIILSAQYFGVSILRDSWIISTTISAVFLQAFFGPINETLRAKFIHVREEKGENFAIESVSSLFSFTLFFSIVILILSLIFNSQLANYFSDQSSNSEPILGLMIKVVLPSIVLNQIINFWTSLLNSHGSFFLPDIYGLVSSVINLLVLIFLTPYIGIYSLVISMYISLIILIIVLWRKLLIINPKLVNLIFFKFKLIKPYLQFAFPFYIAYIFGQLAVVIERKLSTELGVGNVSLLDYSRKFIDLPLSILISITATILTPILALNIAKDNFNGYSKEVMKYFTAITAVFIPIISIFIVCSYDFTIFFFGKESFSTRDFETISLLISYYSIGILGVIFYTISGQALVSEKRVKFYSGIAIFTQLLPIVINLFFYEEYGLITLSLSWSISHLIFGLIMFFSLNIKSIQSWSFVLTVLIFTAIMVSLSFFIYEVAKSMRFEFKIILVLATAYTIELVLFFFLRRLGFNFFLSKDLS